ncbi:PAS domain-containing protein [Arenibacter sp. BSSL-BM3]|uniref:histidine kinase n=1 Tax=Arenibacter arenosicollis TaxID=2762274 RepID=A0ABR7QNC7_9FLAO|nr:PAS domain-containing protein [Arenibacter arenosicollis]MBC8768693.1 PAS domain-containing protein [Arenibacter arenosicollis]
MNKKNEELYFLQGGGEMGKLIRAKDWSKSPLGHPNNWPPSLRTMVAVMLDNPFGMYIAWGKEYTQIYNDGYRPILGSTKHPKALGISTKETFSEIWHIIGSMFDGVMDGIPVGFPDFLLPLNRNGYVENCYFDFAYSPIRMENGEVGGVLVTVIETTNKKKAEDDLKESKYQLEFAIDATDLATWEIDPSTKKFTGDNRLKDWHGLPHDSEFDLETGINVVFEKDRARLSDAIDEALNYDSGGQFNIEYGIVNPNTAQLRIVRAKGKVAFDAHKVPIKFTGTLQNITEEVVANRKKEENERNLRLMILQAPVAIAILRGEDYIIEIANTKTLELFGRQEEEILGQPVFEAIPELMGQGLKDFLDSVMVTGNRFEIDEYPIEINKKDVLETVYLNFSYEPLYDSEGRINGIMAIGYDITHQVLARQKIEKSEQEIRALVESAPFPIAVYAGKEMRISLANQSIKDVWGKGNEVEGKLYTEILPELESQAIFQQVLGVYNTGIPFHAKNQRVDLNIDGNLKPHYFNYSFTPVFENDGSVYGVMNTAAEVTELNEAKRKVEESEKRFRDSVHQAPLGIAIFRGPEFIVELANSAYLMIVDRKSDDFLGQPLFEVLPEVKEAVAPLFKEVVETGIPFYGNEFSVVLNRFGKQDLGYYNFVYHPLKEETGEISGIMVIATEVTKTVNAKKFLEESEKHFRHMVMQSPIPMTILRGKDFIIESANKVMMEKIWRKKEVDVIGHSILEVFPELNNQKYPELLNKVFTNGITHSEKESLAYVNGDDGTRKFYLDFEYSPLLDGEGKVSGLMITVSDVTDKVLARQKVEANEEKLNIVINASELGIWEFDLKTEESVTSDRCLEILGVPNGRELDYKQLISCFHPHDQEARKEAIKKSFKSGHLYYEARTVWKDKSVHWVEAKGKVFYDTDKKAERLVGTIRDITEQKMFATELEKQVKERTRELNKKNIDLKKVNKELEAFAYISSHDLQEPLRKIQTFTSQIMEKEIDNLSETGRNKFLRMQNSANRMQTLIQDLLVYSRTDVQERIFKKTKLSEIIEEVRDDLKEELQQKNVDIEIGKTNEVNVIPFQFRQVMFNLIGNAIKFSKNERILKIRINSKIATGAFFNNYKLISDKNYCKITVSDNGIGFDQEYGEKIFEVFQRLHGKNDYNGTGIGLAIVKKIIENHGGFIFAEGEENKGATFTIFIPAE